MTPLYTEKDYKRVVPATEEAHRGPFRRDNGRLIHSAVFRRLQGKTQLFPSYESDFFRNRLTHSIEVAQIAKGIAEQINLTHPYFKKHPINIDLVDTAALAHDLGHPPFGHNGEKALDDMMKNYGGFEGNAQTLRILARLEKKNTIDPDYVPIKNGMDYRCGLNMTYRALAAILKYDRQIPKRRKQGAGLVKGYYYTESDIVRKIRSHVLGDKSKRGLRTIECQIMDIADDIAYSTYDLEDAFKAEFLSPLGMLVNKPEFIRNLAEEARKKSGDPEITEIVVNKILYETYKEVFQATNVEEIIAFTRERKIKNLEEILKFAIPYGAIEAYEVSNGVCTNGYVRTKHTSRLVHKFMSSIEVGLDPANPAVSEVTLAHGVRRQVEVLKRYTYQAMIESARLKIAEFRGYDIVKGIFEALADNKRNGFDLLPQDFRNLYVGFKSKALKYRVVCDFIAGMTDRYAVEFFARLRSENPQTIFKPF